MVSTYTISRNENFRQLVCNISWDETIFMSQFQFSLHSNVKNLILNMLDLTTLSQTIAQVVQCDNQFFECHREECLELCPIHKNFASPMSFQPLAISSKNDLIRIDECDSTPSQSKRNNDGMQIIFICIMENKVMLFVNV